MQIGDRGIGEGAPCFIIAEVALGHDGSLGMAHAYIDAIASAGADAAKFQTHIAEAESSEAEPFRVPFSPQDKTRLDYWRRTGFTAEQWRGLADHSAEKGLIFLSSPFSIEAVDLLADLDMAAYKIASGEIGNEPMIQYIIEQNRPVLFSSGMSDWAELDRGIDLVRSAGVDVGVFQCTTQYPCPPERLGLNIVPQMRQRYGCPVGLSDHSGTIYAGLAAVTLGVDLLEIHVAMSREMFGPDVVASVTTGELRQLVEGVWFVERALAGHVDKDALQEEFQPLREIFTQSVVTTANLPTGTVLERDHLSTRKPGTGIPARDLDQLVGRTLARDVLEGTYLSYEDFE